MIMSISVFLVFFAIFMLVSSFVLYPLLLLLSRFLPRNKGSKPSEIAEPESVSFILVMHNAEQLIAHKLNNILQLNLGNIKNEIIVYLDGCSDHTLQKLQALAIDNLTIINETAHLGKIAGLNTAAERAQGDILIFTDADAILEKNVVSTLLTHFKDPRCGGVCGLRAIKEKQGKLHLAQHVYITVDSYIKKLETYLGNITSNDGKLYAVRRSLFKPIADAVTDDLYSCLNITEQHYRFVFEPKAIAHISTPSRHERHEYSRRRRIVTRSLNGLWLKRKLLNPFQYGLFSLGLIINKIFRRLMGMTLLLLFISSYFASSYSICIAVLFYVQLGFYLLAGIYPLLLLKHELLSAPFIRHLTSVCWYFCLGNYATSLGVVDFLSGKRVSKWVPQKHT